MFASFGTASGDLDGPHRGAVEDPAVQDTVREHELATSHYMATPEHFLWHARQADDKGSAADFLSAVIVDEKSVWDYNRGITSRDGVTRVEGAPPEEQLVPIYPTDGFYGADNPAVVLTGDWVDQNEADAAADFIRYAGTAQGQEIVRDVGLSRPQRRRSTPASPTSPTSPPTPQGALPLPEQDVVAAVNTAFPEVRKRAQVLFLMDVSGSMDEPISATDTKLTAAKAAIAQALDHFTAGDNVGLAAFAQAPDGSMLPGNVSPIADIGTITRRVPRRARRPAVDGRHPAVPGRRHVRGAAGAVLVIRPHHRDRAAERRRERHANAPTIGAEQMLADLQAMHHDTPVLVFTLAYGADADVATLQSISSATGAHYYDATDPTKLKAVLGDLVTSF